MMMTSATERLRALLDERGVEYTIDHGYREFFWDFGESGRARASAIGTKGLVQMIVTGITPEQAIAATLGPGTCHAVFELDAMSEDERIGEFVCSECGETFGDGRDQVPRYCPSCGAKVVA